MSRASTISSVRARVHVNVHAPSARGVVNLLLEVTIAAVFIKLYFLGRTLADGHVALAFSHAHELWGWERQVRLPSELSVQHWLIDHHHVASWANRYYAGVHFPLTIFALAWFYFRDRVTYYWTRDVLLCITAAGLALAFMFPLAPPRMMSGLGFADLPALYGQSVYKAPGTDAANQFAAMPSLHVGWALVVALAFIAWGRSRSRWRFAWALHPIITLVVVVGTGNHYWSDGLIAIALITAAVPPATWMARRRQRQAAAVAAAGARAVAMAPFAPVASD